jgi:DNA-binding response OmpR family regulator
VRLLIVEDELDLATALATGLRREGYAIDTAPGTKIGLIPAHPASIVLTGVSMLIVSPS